MIFISIYPSRLHSMDKIKVLPMGCSFYFGTGPKALRSIILSKLVISSCFFWVGVHASPPCMRTGHMRVFLASEALESILLLRCL